VAAAVGTSQSIGVPQPFLSYNGATPRAAAMWGCRDLAKGVDEFLGVRSPEDNDVGSDPARDCLPR